jgi:ABC-type xylose transport system permease subunit
MAKESLTDELRIYLEGVENYWLALAVIMLFFIFVSTLTLFGVYIYTRH